MLNIVHIITSRCKMLLMLLLQQLVESLFMGKRNFERAHLPVKGDGPH